MGAVRMRVHQIKSSEMLGICKKQIHQDVFNLKPLFLKIHNIAFSSEKVVLYESGEKYAQIKYR